MLDKLAPRVVRPHPDTPFIVAWGDPAVVFRCGVARPGALHPNSTAQVYPGGPIKGPYFLVMKDSADDAHVWTTVDRAAYISVTIPDSYQGSTIIAPLARAIGSTLPAVCVAATTGSTPPKQLCDRRK